MIWAAGHKVDRLCPGHMGRHGYVNNRSIDQVILAVASASELFPALTCPGRHGGLFMDAQTCALESLDHA